MGVESGIADPARMAPSPISIFQKKFERQSQNAHISAAIHVKVNENVGLGESVEGGRVEK